MNTFTESRHDSIPFDSYLCAHTRNRFFHTFCGRSDGRIDSTTKWRWQSRRNHKALQTRGLKNAIYLWSIKFIMLDQKVWISIVASMFCVAVVTWLTTKLTTKYSCPHGRETQTQAVESRLSNHILVAFEIICCQGIIYTCNSQLAKFVNCKYIFALRPICFAKYFTFDSNHNVGLVSRECRSYISLQWMLSLIPHYP